MIQELPQSDTFNARVAGNIVNDDILGSLEFSCALSGAKLVLVIGHAASGASSEILRTLEKDGKIKIVGSMYHLVGDRVEFYA